MSEEELLKTRIEVIKYLSDGYMLNVIVDVINDTIELLQEYKQLEQENKKYKEVIDKAIEYLEAKRIREKAIVDIDVLEGILKEVE